MTLPDDGWASVFNGCTSLETLRLPGDLTSFSGMLIFGCTSLKTLVIPKGVKFLNISSFESCTALESIILEQGSELECLDFDTTMEINLKMLVLPAGVTVSSVSDLLRCDQLVLYIVGDEGDWAAIEEQLPEDDYDDRLDEYISKCGLRWAGKRYYSAQRPTTTPGRYWHYVDGIPTVWE